MEDTLTEKNSRRFSDYFYILFKWKKILIINLLIILTITTTLTFLIPKTYKANCIIMIPPESSLNLGL